MKARTRTFLGHLLKIEQILFTGAAVLTKPPGCELGFLGTGALHRPGGVNGSMNLRDRTEKESSSYNEDLLRPV